MRISHPLLAWGVGGLAVKSVATSMLQAQQLWDGVLPKRWLSVLSFQNTHVLICTFLFRRLAPYFDASLTDDPIIACWD